MPKAQDVLDNKPAAHKGSVPPNLVLSISVTVIWAHSTSFSFLIQKGIWSHFVRRDGSVIFWKSDQGLVHGMANNKRQGQPLCGTAYRPPMHVRQLDHGTTSGDWLCVLGRTVAEPIRAIIGDRGRHPCLSAGIHSIQVPLRDAHSRIEILPPNHSPLWPSFTSHGCRIRRDDQPLSRILPKVRSLTSRPGPIDAVTLHMHEFR